MVFGLVSVGISAFLYGRANVLQYGEYSTVYELAYSVGKLLAQAGFGIANGGYAGVMEASAAGAAKAGGLVTGVTCRAFKSAMANEYITKEIVTETLDQRIDTLIKAGDAFVVLPGGTGTLLELAKVWELKNKGFFLNSR